jgi:hypothetical protein
LTLFDIPPWELIVRSIAVYLALVLALRVFGKREIGQFTLFDLVLVLLVANAVQPAMTGPDTSLGGGLLIILTLVLTNRGLAEARRRLPFLRVVLESSPTTIARDGAWLTEAVEHEELDAEDLRTLGKTDHPVSWTCAPGISPTCRAAASAPRGCWPTSADRCAKDHRSASPQRD